MSELILLSLDYNDTITRHKKALAGNPEATAYFATLFDAYKDQALACFICDRPVPFPPHMMILPEFKDSTKLIGAPLCKSCQDLNPPVRWSRCLKTLQKMFSARSGKNVHFTFHQPKFHR